MSPDPWPEWKLAPCGTAAAYRRHRRRGERACNECLAAERRWTSERNGYQPASLTPDYRPVRNGIPWKPYRYRAAR